MQRFGVVRTTEWGIHFDVKTQQSRQDVLTEDLAYTNEPIDLHHDNPYRNPTPGYWCLMCLRDAAAGGLSIVSDGLYASILLRETNPEMFDILTKVKVRFSYISEESKTALVTETPHILLDYEGNIQHVTYSGRLDEVPASGYKYSLEEIDMYYRAKKKWLQLARENALR